MIDMVLASQIVPRLSDAVKAEAVLNVRPAPYYDVTPTMRATYVLREIVMST